MGHVGRNSNRKDPKDTHLELGRVPGLSRRENDQRLGQEKLRRGGRVLGGTHVGRHLAVQPAVRGVS